MFSKRSQQTVSVNPKDIENSEFMCWKSGNLNFIGFLENSWTFSAKNVEDITVFLVLAYYFSKYQNIIKLIVGLCHRRSPLQELKCESHPALKSFHSVFCSELFGPIFFEARATKVMTLLRGLIFFVLPISLVFPFGSPLGYP